MDRMGVERSRFTPYFLLKDYITTEKFFMQIFQSTQPYSNKMGLKIEKTALCQMH